MKTKILLVLGCAMILAACKLQYDKRLYNRGYFVRFAGKKHHELVANSAGAKRKVMRKQEPVASKQGEPLMISENITADETAGSATTHNIAEVHEIKTNSGNEWCSPVYRKPVVHLQKYSGRKEEERKNSDLMFYGVAGLMALATAGMLKKNRKTVLKVTRLANRNKIASRVVITGLKGGLATLGVLAGRDLYSEGYVLSDTFNYTFTGIMAAAFIGASLLERSKNMVLMNSFQLRKMSHALIGLSLFMTSASIGNSLPQHKVQNTVIGYTAQKIEKQGSAEKFSFGAKEQKRSGGKGALIAAYVLLALIMLVVLTVLTCAAFCSGGALAGIAALVGSIVLLVVVINAMSGSIEKRYPQTPKS